MPYKSDAQRKFFHTKTAKSKGITETMTKEYDKASKSKKLPEHVDAKEDKEFVKRIKKGK